MSETTNGDQMDEVEKLEAEITYLDFAIDDLGDTELVERRTVVKERLSILEGLSNVS